MSELNPKRLLKGATLRLIDKWQLALELWDAICFKVDHRGEMGQFLPLIRGLCLSEIRWCLRRPYRMPEALILFGGMINEYT